MSKKNTFERAILAVLQNIFSVRIHADPMRYDMENAIKIHANADLFYFCLKGCLFLEMEKSVCEEIPRTIEKKITFIEGYLRAEQKENTLRILSLVTDRIATIAKTLQESETFSQFKEWFYTDMVKKEPCFKVEAFDALFHSVCAQVMWSESECLPCIVPSDLFRSAENRIEQNGTLPFRFHARYGEHSFFRIFQSQFIVEKLGTGSGSPMTVPNIMKNDMMRTIVMSDPLAFYSGVLESRNGKELTPKLMGAIRGALSAWRQAAAHGLFRKHAFGSSMPMLFEDMGLLTCETSTGILKEYNEDVFDQFDLINELMVLWERA